jgi:23S rRNA G2069 N7-methylase RlmK/C1962 C5-methylase RlmI/23S rRNA-/tRNA-specific pseudouridylate synthase
VNFLRLNDPLLSVLFEDDDILAIDKPYGFNCHTNDSKIEHSEFIQDGLIETYEKQLGKKLHIVHRLDQTTTGVMIFGKSIESAKKYADFFRNRQVKKTYWFITKSNSTKTAFLIEDSILHKGKELDAKTQLNLIKRSAPFELWKANPYTGRNHQIRIHAKAAGISILGDPKYGGVQFSFLCLHNHLIEFPNGISIRSKPTIYFEDTTILNDHDLARAYFETDRRQRLYSNQVDQDQCFRLAHSPNGNESIGYNLDQFGKVLLLTWNRDFWSETEIEKFTHFAKTLGKPLLVRFKSDRSTPPLRKITLNATKLIDEDPKTWEAKEGDLKFEFRGEAGHSAGLILNQRLQRNWVLRNSLNKSVLNLFSSTGGYAVAAAKGSATQLCSVDTNKNSLNWARKNFELNNIDASKFQFYCRDSITYLEQCLAKNLKFDLIISDTPAFMKREKKDFKIKSDLLALLENCLRCLNSGGTLLFSTTFDGFYIPDIQKNILSAQKNLGIKELSIDCILPSLDFELPDEKSDLKSFLIRLGSN